VTKAADRRSDSREFHTEGTAVEKACDAKYEATAAFSFCTVIDTVKCDVTKACDVHFHAVRI